MLTGVLMATSKILVLPMLTSVASIAASENLSAVHRRLRAGIADCSSPVRFDVNWSLPIKQQANGNSVAGSAENLFSRRPVIICTGASLASIFMLNSVLIPSPAEAEEKNMKVQEDEGGSGVLGAIKSLFDPDEETKSGKVLPKAYLESAREVVKTLRESVQEDSKDVAKFRRSADAAKESIREYLNGWRGQQAVRGEESYAALEKAIRSLAEFYSMAGPFASLSEEVKNSILDYLNAAEANL